MASPADESDRTPLASFEKINYAIRPAKSTERRMMIEAFGRLSACFSHFTAINTSDSVRPFLSTLFGCIVSTA